jgi:hypothetical protein
MGWKQADVARDNKTRIFLLPSHALRGSGVGLVGRGFGGGPLNGIRGNERRRDGQRLEARRERGWAPWADAKNTGRLLLCEARRNESVPGTSSIAMRKASFGRGISSRWAGSGGDAGEMQ